MRGRRSKAEGRHDSRNVTTVGEFCVLFNLLPDELPPSATKAYPAKASFRHALVIDQNNSGWREFDTDADCQN
jgi:hypothetical protein